MLRYRMGTKTPRFGWVVVVFVIGLLLVIIAGQLGSKQQPVTNLPASTKNDAGGVLLQYWENVKSGFAILWNRVMGSDQAEQVSVDLSGSPASGAGTDEEDTPANQDVTVEAVKPQQPDAFVPVGLSPQVLIYHTHTHEAYTKLDGQDYVEVAKWRTVDDAFNIVRVGDALATALSAKFGIAVLHDKTDNEFPKLGTSYSRSLKTVQNDMDANKDLKILIDLHRDAFNASIDPPAITINGKKVARIMLVIGTGQGQTGVGFTLRPDWQKNLVLAQAITDRLNQFDPQLARKISVKTGRYNQHLSTGAILIEVGHNQNTLDEALNAVPFLSQAIADVYNDMIGSGNLQPATAPVTSAPPSASPSASASPAASATSLFPTQQPSPTPQSSPSPTPGPASPAPRVITIEPLATQTSWLQQITR